jgi:hypothetical protein
MAQDMTPDGRWMSYGELARIRGIDRQSAVKLVRRQRWRRQPGNQGEVLVLVPSEALTRAMARDEASDVTGAETPDIAPDTAAFETALAAIEAAHGSEVAALRERVDAAELSRVSAQAQLADATAKADRAEVLAEAERARADRATARADQERLAADRFRAEAETARAELQQAQQATREAEDAAEALRRAEETRKARGRLRRVWDGWRGR